MQYRKIADLSVSAVCIGGNIFGYSCDKGQSFAVLDAADSLGVNFVDTSDTYSNGESESFIGAWSKIGRRNWIVASKIGLESHGDPAGLGGKDVIRRKLEQSLRRLQRECIDLYQIHHYDTVTPIAETLETATTLMREGKIRHFGVSNFSGAALDRYIQTASLNGYEPPKSIQAHFNLLARSSERNIFPICGPNHVAVIAYGVLARSILSERHLDDQAHAASGSRVSKSHSVRSDVTPGTLAALARISDYARARGTTTPRLALAYALAKKPVAAATIGVRLPAQLADLVPAIDVRLDPQDIAALEALAATGESADGKFGAPTIHG